MIYKESLTDIYLHHAVQLHFSKVAVKEAKIKHSKKVSGVYSTQGGSLNQDSYIRRKATPPTVAIQLRLSEFDI